MFSVYHILLLLEGHIQYYEHLGIMASQTGLHNKSIVKDMIYMVK